MQWDYPCLHLATASSKVQSISKWDSWMKVDRRMIYLLLSFTAKKLQIPRKTKEECGEGWHSSMAGRLTFFPRCQHTLFWLKEGRWGGDKLLSLSTPHTWKKLPVLPGSPKGKIDCWGVRMNRGVWRSLCVVELSGVGWRWGKIPGMTAWKVSLPLCHTVVYCIQVSGYRECIAYRCFPAGPVRTCESIKVTSPSCMLHSSSYCY